MRYPVCLCTALLAAVCASDAHAQLLATWAQKIDSTDGGFTGPLDPADRFGRSIVGIGDLDGDGITDVVVGARSDDDGATDAGALYVLFMNRDGTVRAEQKISALSGGLAAGSLDASDYFGYSIAPLGDLDGDGAVDIAVGAPNDDDGAQNAGAVYVLFLHPNGTVKAQQKISSTVGGLGSSLLNAGDNFGIGLGNLGDLNGDGIVDIGVGASGDDGGGMNRGAVHLVSLRLSGRVKGLWEISDGVGGFGGSLDNGDSFGGRGLNLLGDLDGDGISEIGVGAFRDDDGGPDRGAFWVLFMDASVQVTAWQKVSQTAGGFTGTLGDGDLFGMCLAPLGDANGDGVPDLITGSNRDDDGGADRGAVYILHMNPDGTVQETIKISSLQNPFADLYIVDGERFGRALGVIGDLAGDGSLTIGVGAGAGGGNGGAVWLLTFERPVGTQYCVATPNSTGVPAPILATGRTTASQGPLKLRASNLPTNQFGYFISSLSSGFVPNFGGSDGNLCVGSPLIRYVKAVGSSGSDGVAIVPVDPTAPPNGPALQAGETWYFQYWTRDTSPTTTSNTTDGVSVVFQ